MHRDKFVKIAIPILAILLLNSVYFGFGMLSTPKTQVELEPAFQFPALNTMYMQESWPWTTALVDAEACKIDVYLGAIQTSAIDTLSGLGWTVTHSGGGLHYCYLGINCRDYSPSTGASPFVDYHGRPNGGFALFPLNVSSFRYALPYIVGCEKTAWCWNLLSYIVVRNDFPMPTGFTQWRNPYIIGYFAEDWTFAEDILLENGFTVTKGNPNDRTTWIWYCPLRPGDASRMKLIGGKNSASPGSDRPSGDGFGIYVMSPGPAPTSVQMTQWHVSKWNTFFTGETGTALPGDPDWNFELFHHDVAATTGYMISVIWDNRNHDIFYLCGSFSAKQPDYLFDTFHSSQDVYDGGDDSGIVNPSLDQLLYSIKYFMMNDYEILAYNTGEEPEVYVDASTHYTIAQPTDVLDIKIQRCDKTGVYYQYLVAGVDYTLVGTDLHILKDITLYQGDVLEVNYHPGTYSRLITDMNFYTDIVFLADWEIWYLEPQIGVYSRDYFDLFKPGLEDFCVAPGYGAGAYNLPFTFGEIHWAGAETGGAMKWQNEGDVVNLNPVKAKWVYEMEILDRIYEGLIMRNPGPPPLNGREEPWIALKTTEAAWTAPGDVPGEKITFYLRNDVTWQDGTPVTAEDIKWNFDYINHTCPDIGNPMPEYLPIWSYYVKSEIVDDYTVNIYINTTGHWKVLDYAGVALQFPKVIWQNLITYADISAFKPWKVSYATQVGSPPPNGLQGLSCLMGTGPFFLNMTAGGWNEADLAVLSRYPGYWINTAGNMPAAPQYDSTVAGMTPGSIVNFWYFDDDNITFDYMITCDNAPNFRIVWVGPAYTNPVLDDYHGSITLEGVDNQYMTQSFIQNLPAWTQKFGYRLYIRVLSEVPSPGGQWPGTWTLKYVVPAKVKMVAGDLGGGIPPTWFNFDGVVDWKDVFLFRDAFLRGNYMLGIEIADLGGGVPPTFGAFDCMIDWKDVFLFRLCFLGQGPDP